MVLMESPFGTPVNQDFVTITIDAALRAYKASFALDRIWSEVYPFCRTDGYRMVTSDLASITQDRIRLSSPIANEELSNQEKIDLKNSVKERQAWWCFLTTTARILVHANQLGSAYPQL